MVNPVFMPEDWETIYKNDIDKAKKALNDEIARVARVGKLLKPEPFWGDQWSRPGKPPLVVKV
jgi:hypothetical protein